MNVTYLNRFIEAAALQTQYGDIEIHMALREGTPSSATAAAMRATAD